MASTATKITVAPRETTNSRAVRRLRRSGRVPGVLYGGGADHQPVCFDVDALELRHALAARGAVLEIDLAGGETVPAVLKDAQYDAVRGDTLHIDLLRVRLDVAIHVVVALELTGVDEAPGVVEGGVLDHVTRELNVEALPTAVPDAIRHDVSDMAMNDTLFLSAVTAPDGVVLLDDPEETVVATLSPPRLEVEPVDEIETETELIGEDGEPIEGEAAEGDGDGEAGDAGSSGDASSDDS